ncbi:MAG: C25 family cysteine peptidase, partial [Flavobacteriales bacterium]
SSEVLEQAPAAAVEQLIEQEGVTLMTFFAHAYSSNFDITIDDPANYEWNGKHPMVIANSCYIGNIHQNGSLSASENWVGLDNAGPNAFLASVKQGVPALLHDYTSRFYRSFGQVNYGGTIGDHMRYAAFSMLSNNSNLPALFHVHTFTLQGDPLLKLNSPPEPDFVVRDQDILFVPEYVNADVDTFQVKVAITNIGRATNATMSVA